MSQRTLPIFILLFSALAWATPELQIPFKGDLSDSSVSLSGDVYMKFALYESSGNTTVWSNDGTGVGSGPAEPISGVTVSLTDGLFTVWLGDTSVTNMTALSKTTFDTGNLYLRIWLSEDAVTFTQLSPDKRMSAEPFAFRAHSAETADDATTLAGVTPGATGLALLADASVNEAVTTLGLGTASANASTDFAPASHGHAHTEISGLGDLATQSSSGVSITGGSLAGVTISSSALDVSGSTNLSGLVFPSSAGNSGQLLALGSDGALDWMDAGVASGSNAYAFKAYITAANQMIAGWTPSDVVNFDATEFDTTGGALINGGNTFKPTIEGYYLLNARAEVENVSLDEYAVVRIYKNGSFHSEGSIAAPDQEMSGDPHAGTILTTLVYADGVNDYFDIRVYHTHNDDKELDGDIEETWFAGVLLSAGISGGSTASANIEGLSSVGGTLNASGNLDVGADLLVMGSANLGGISFPSSNGTPGQQLTVGADGTLEWQDVAEASGNIDGLTSSAGDLIAAGNFETTGDLVVGGSANLGGLVFPSSAGNSGQLLSLGADGTLDWMDSGVASGSDTYAFSVSLDYVDQTAPNVATVIPFSKAEFDTTGGALVSGNQRFQPTVAGTYLLTGQAQILSIDNGAYSIVTLEKNGTTISRGVRVDNGAVSSQISMVTALVMANGTTDYFELSTNHNNASGRTLSGNIDTTRFSGVLLSATGESSSSGNAVSFKLRRPAGSGINVPDSVETLVDYTEIEYDNTDGALVSGNNRFQPTEPGIYLLTATATLSGMADGTSFGLLLKENGVTVKRGVRIATGVTSSVTASVTTLVEADGSGDYYEIFILNTDTDGGNEGYANGDEYHSFEGVLVSPSTTVVSSGTVDGLSSSSGNLLASGNLEATGDLVVVGSANLGGLVFPSSVGTPGQQLTLGASGNLEWQDMTVASGANAYAFSVSLGNVDRSAPNTATTIPFTTVEFDTTGGALVSGNQRFQPTVAGTYLLTGQASVTVDSGAFGRVILEKNGTMILRGARTVNAATGEQVSSISHIVTANGTTDYFELSYNHNHGSSRTMSGDQLETRFSGVLLSATGSGSGSGNIDGLTGTIEQVDVSGNLVVAGSANIGGYLIEPTSLSEVYVKAEGNGGEAITGDVTDIPFTEIQDPEAAWDGTAFVTPSTGDYLVSGTLDKASTTATSAKAYVDGAHRRTLGVSEGTTFTSFSGVVSLVAGESLTIRTGISTTLNNTAATHNLYIRKLTFTQILSGNSGASIDGLTGTAEQVDVSGNLVVGGSANLGGLVFPDTTGSVNQVLAFDSSGNLDWASVAINSGNTTVSGGDNNIAGSDFSTVSGGENNTASSSSHATVGGGDNNTATGIYSAIGGGQNNTATQVGTTVGGGLNNESTGTMTTVGGGSANEASGAFAVVAGGSSNDATGGFSFVGGGGTNQATNSNAVVGGGGSNQASGTHSVVTGGFTNVASADYTTVAGGRNNDATATDSTVGGGKDNQATGSFSTVPGGEANHAAGDYSVAMGKRMQLDANADGTFVFGTAASATTLSAPDAFLVFPVEPNGADSGRLGIGTKSPSHKLDVVGSANLSDNLMVVGSANIGTTLQVSSAIEVGEKLAVGGALKLDGNNARILMFRENGHNYFDYNEDHSLVFRSANVQDDTNHTNQMVLDSGGNLTVTGSANIGGEVFPSDLVAARYTSDNGQTVAQNDPILFEDIDYDTHSAYNTATGNYLVPVSGYYQVSATYFENTSTGTGIAIKVNSTTKTSVVNETAVGESISVSDMLLLNAGDVLSVHYTRGGSASLSGTVGRNVFTIFRLR